MLFFVKKAARFFGRSRREPGDLPRPESARRDRWDGGGAVLRCPETGTAQPILHRHIRETLGMTPDEYRRKWNLPGDMPLVSAGYRAWRAESRRMERLE
ncbi:MucR family transcriptional regulator [Brevirhabdus sp.]|uniref:MucR family transcriptional regulator n=1 Tax=Brevirhabdus sp. TaxID=2004514 RepID=UPI0040582139